MTEGRMVSTMEGKEKEGFAATTGTAATPPDADLKSYEPRGPTPSLP